MPEPTVRQAGEADAKALAPLYEQFYTEDGIKTGPDDIRRNLSAMLADDRAAIWVAENAGEIVGFSSATLTLGVEFGWASELEDLYILPEFRGKGLARTILQAAVNWAEENGATDVILVITPEAEADQGLVGFYDKLGFRKSDRIVMYKSGNQ